jgi:hypothetical protein
MMRWVFWGVEYCRGIFLFVWNLAGTKGVGLVVISLRLNCKGKGLGLRAVSGPIMSEVHRVGIQRWLETNILVEGDSLGKIHFTPLNYPPICTFNHNV